MPASRGEARQRRVAGAAPAGARGERAVTDARAPQAPTLPLSCRHRRRSASSGYSRTARARLGAANRERRSVAGGAPDGRLRHDRLRRRGRRHRGRAERRRRWDISPIGARSTAGSLARAQQAAQERHGDARATRSSWISRKVTAAEFVAARREYPPALAGRLSSRLTASPAPSNYTVKRGDSLWIIAQQHGDMPIWLVAQYNPDVDFNDMRPGTTDHAAAGRDHQSSVAARVQITRQGLARVAIRQRNARMRRQRGLAHRVRSSALDGHALAAWARRIEVRRLAPGGDGLVGGVRQLGASMTARLPIRRPRTSVTAPGECDVRELSSRCRVRRGPRARNSCCPCCPIRSVRGRRNSRGVTDAYGTPGLRRALDELDAASRASRRSCPCARLALPRA